MPTIRLGMKFYLLSMVRKSELQGAVWADVDFKNAVWSIPKEQMKRSKALNVYLSQQMLDILIALKTCAGNSRYLLLSRYDADPSRAILVNDHRPSVADMDYHRILNIVALASRALGAISRGERQRVSQRQLALGSATRGKEGDFEDPRAELGADPELNGPAPP